MPKITKKMMNKIHNEMRKRFTPSWERQNARIQALEDRIKALEPKPVDELAQKRIDKGREVMLNAMNEVLDRDTLVPNTVTGSAVWTTRFTLRGSTAVCQLPVGYLRVLDRIGVTYIARGGINPDKKIRVELLPSSFPGKISLLEEQLRRLTGEPVIVRWKRL